MSELDPAMIKRALTAAEYAIDHWHELQEHGGPIEISVRAAAGVIVPATAAAIAAAIEATGVNNAPQFAVIARSFAVPEPRDD